MVGESEEGDMDDWELIIDYLMCNRVENNFLYI